MHFMRVAKKPAAEVRTTKKPATSTVNERDKRSSGRWMWAAVAVGKGSEVWTHDNQKKTFTFKLLPKPSDAPNGKPKGLASIRSTLKAHVAPGSILIFDKWLSTVSAVKELGFQECSTDQPQLVLTGRKYRLSLQ